MTGLIQVDELRRDLKQYYCVKIVSKGSAVIAKCKDAFMGNQIYPYLECVQHDKKFAVLDFDDHIRDQLKHPDCDFLKMSEAYKALETYAFNLISYPWRQLFTVIKEHGFFRCKLAPYVSNIGRIWNAMGYYRHGCQWKLSDKGNGLVDLTTLAIDLLIAAMECRMMHEVYQKVIIHQRLPSTSIPPAVKLEIIRNVYDARVLCIGTADECFGWMLSNHVLKTDYMVFDNSQNEVEKPISNVFIEDTKPESPGILDKRFDNNMPRVDYDDGGDDDLYSPSPLVLSKNALTQDEHIEASLACVLADNTTDQPAHQSFEKQTDANVKRSLGPAQYHSLQSQSSVQPKLVPTTRSRDTNIGFTSHGRSLSDSDNFKFTEKSSYTEKQDRDVGKDRTACNKIGGSQTRTLFSDVANQYTSSAKSSPLRTTGQDVKIKYPEDLGVYDNYDHKKIGGVTSARTDYQNVKTDTKKLAPTFNTEVKVPPRTTKTDKLGITFSKTWTCPVCVNFNRATDLLCTSCRTRKDAIWDGSGVNTTDSSKYTSEKQASPRIPSKTERSVTSDATGSGYVPMIAPLPVEKPKNLSIPETDCVTSCDSTTSESNKSSPKSPTRGRVSSAGISGKVEKTHISSATAKISSKPKSANLGSWECPHCTTTNQTTSNVCEVCNKSKDFGVAKKSSPSEGKKCPACTFVNPKRTLRCKACENLIPNTTETSV